MNAIELIKRERRQIDNEGWTPEHDEEYRGGEIALAACCYAAPCRLYILKSPSSLVLTMEDPWPWHPRHDLRYDCGQPTTGGFFELPEPSTYTLNQRIDLLVKAGALIAVEIDRLVHHVQAGRDADRLASKLRSGQSVAVEMAANWRPLEAKLGPEYCWEFKWMYRQDGIEYYKHIDTRNYLRLDAAGRCVIRTAEGWKEVDFEPEWKRVSGRA